MRFKEIISEMPFGAPRQFGGYGNGYFQQRFYVYIAKELSKVHDEHAKEFLIDWFTEAFKKDNPKFKPDVFKQAAETGKVVVRSTPQFQQRHFYYLAELVSQVSDEHVKEFLTDWLAEVIGGTNPNFLPDRWKRYCQKGY